MRLPYANPDGSVHFPASRETLEALTAWVRTLREQAAGMRQP